MNSRRRANISLYQRICRWISPTPLRLGWDCARVSPMTREEAFLIFDKLRTDGAFVFCTGRLWGWTVALKGKVVSATREEIILVSADRASGSMSIRLDMDDLLIRYAEPREIPILQGMPPRDM